MDAECCDVKRNTTPTGRTPGEIYTAGMLVRVVCDAPRSFVAGMIVDRETERVVFTAPLLRHLMGQHRAKLRQTFARLGWRATIVR